MITQAANLATSEDDYHSRLEISRSDLALFKESRRKFRAVKDGRIQEKITDAMDIGTCTHLLTLEPEKFLEKVVVWDAVRSGAKWKQFKAKADASRQTVLREKDWWLVVVCAAMLRGRMREIIDHPGGFREKTIIFNHSLKSGEEVSLRCRLDLGIQSPREMFIFDIKTLADVKNVRHDIKDRGYWLQDAQYTAAAMAEFGLPFESVRFVFLPVGKTICNQIAESVKDDECEWGINQINRVQDAVKGLEPLATGAVEIDESERRTAMRKWADLIEDYAECERSGDWSDPGEDDVKVVDGVIY